MVSLGVPAPNETTPIISDQPTSSSSWRDTQLWVPSIPPADLCLEEKTIFRPGLYLHPYHPYYYILFGGHHGQHRDRLMSIALCVRNDNFVFGIELMYNAAVDGRTIHTLGRSMHLLREFPNYRRVIFTIDGPSGETIESLMVEHHSINRTVNFVRVRTFRPCYCLLSLTSSQVITNRGRVFVHPSNAESRSTSALQPPNGRLEGIYVAMVSDNLPTLERGLNPADEHSISLQGEGSPTSVISIELDAMSHCTASCLRRRRSKNTRSSGCTAVILCF